jgi:hypothetical protein
MFIVDYHNRIVEFPVYEWTGVSSFTSFNSVLWGLLPFHSNVLGQLMFREESHLWERLFTKRSSDFLRPVNYFNNVDEEARAPAFVRVPAGDSGSIGNMITRILRHKPNYIDFLSIYHAMAEEEGIRYEMFQKSFLYEIFFHLLRKETLVCRPVFLAVRRRYLGLDACESLLNDVLEFYSHKYAYMIIPRRHGKTFMTGSAFVALLFTFLQCGLKLGYYSHTKDLSQTVKNYVIGKCNEWTTKLTQSRYNIVTPADSVMVRIVTDQNTTVFSNQEQDFNCLAKFKSARNDNALRGDDLNLLIVDESFSINKSRFGTILAHGQKTDNKIIFLTSPVNHKVDTMVEVTRGLACRRDINLYHVYYFCNNADHLKFASRQPACPKLIFYKPDHINIDETNRYLTNLLTQSSTSYDDELGILPSASAAYGTGTAKLCPFSDRLINYMKYSVNTIGDTTGNVFVYLDPNYCDSLSSGIGLVASSITREETPCVLYLDHKFIESEELGKVNEIMVKMLLQCIRHVSCAAGTSRKRGRDGELLRQRATRNVFVAVENNSQRNSIVVMYDQLKLCYRNSDVRVFLYYSPTENRITKKLHKRAGYTLLNKFSIFSQTIQFVNDKLIWFSDLLYSHHLHEADKNEIEYLRQNMQDFKFCPQEKKFSGKSHSTTDDLVVALIMSVFLARTYTSVAERGDWLSLTCWAPISEGVAK